uniref:Uncharacterized protein n=1 Tax=Romanomermis culicivorax TaxID=13658 RepID=A0A915JPP8_ROMCU
MAFQWRFYHIQLAQRTPSLRPRSPNLGK